MSSLADLPELVGFFSYSREDDEGMKGALSALRDGIQRELSAQLGRSKSNFRLWQDHEAIAPGRLWESEIAAAIEQSVFFIPMVTPRVIRSKHCKFEFESFLGREKALGRTDLVFPILYMTVAALEDEAQWRNDPLLSIIGKRQYVDWRQFRHLDPQQTTVREAIERFCSKIVAALDQPIPAAGQAADPRILALHAAEEEERAKQRAQDERRIEAERLAQETRRRDEAAERLRQEQDERLAAERRKAQVAEDEARRQRDAQRAAAEAERLRREREDKLAAERRREEEEAAAAQRAAAEAERLRREREDKLAAERRREQEAAAEAQRLREKEEARAAERRRESKPEPAIDPASIGPSVPTVAPTLARRVVGAAILPLLLLLAWQLGSMTKAIDPLLLPAPTDIVASWLRLASGELPGDVMSTLVRFLLGTLAGIVAALALGKLLTISPRIRILMAPLLRFLVAIPAVAFLPAATIMLGIGLGAGAAVTAIAIFFPALASFMAHGAGNPPDAPAPAQSPGSATSWGIRFAVAFAFSAALASEMAAPGGAGLGMKLLEFGSLFDVGGSFAIVLTAGLLAAAINAIAVRTSRFVSDTVRNRAAMRPDAPERSQPETASDAPLWRRMARGAAAPVLLLVLWQAAAALGLESYFFPAPVTVVAEWFRNLESIAGNAGSSVLRLIGGVLLGLMPALALVRAMVARPRIGAYLLPLVRILGAIPAIVWVPLAMLWFGIGPSHILFAVAVGAFFPVLLRMKAEPVRLPDVLPGTIAAIKVAFMVLLTAEFVASDNGLGYLMMVAATQLDTASVLGALVTTGLIGLAIESAVTLAVTRASAVASAGGERSPQST